MKRFPVYLLSLLLVLTACLSGCRKGGRVIPQGDFIDIVTEMLLADQWIDSNVEQKKASDTCAFYLPIFQRYGYSTVDYVTSVRFYLGNPEKYSKMIEKVESRLQLETKRLQKIKAESDKAHAFNAGIFGYTPKDFNTTTINNELSREVLVQPGRDTTFQQDSVSHLQR